VAALMAEAEKAPTLRANLRELTDEIGGRVPGTPAMERAIRWGIEKFQAAGADEVHPKLSPSSTGGVRGATRVLAKFAPNREREKLSPIASDCRSSLLCVPLR